MVRNHHVYKNYTPLIDEVLQVAQNDTSKLNEYSSTVAITEEDTLVSIYLSREISRIYSFILKYGTINHLFNHR